MTRRGYVVQGLLVIILLVLAFDLLPVLRGCCGWQWQYGLPESVGDVLPLVGILVIYLAGTIWLLRRKHPTNTTRRVTIVWATLGTFIITLAFIQLHENPYQALFARTTSPVYTGSLIASAYEISPDPDAALQNWTTVMESLADTSNIHVALSPPGQPLIHHWFSALFERTPEVARITSEQLRPLQCSTLPVVSLSRAELTSAVPGMLMPLWVSLGCLILYQLVRVLTNKDLALRIVVWYPLIPGLHYFAPTWNTFYPVLVLLLLLLLVYAYTRSAWRIYALLAGMVMSLLTFLNLSVIPVIMLAGWFTLLNWFFLDYRTHKHTFRRPLEIGAWFGAGLLSIWLIYGVYSGITPFDIITTAFDQHLDIERDYLTWVVLHVYDVFLFAGFPLIAIVLWQVVRLRRESIQRADVLLLSTLLTLLIMTLSGTARGETGRVWLFFVPVLLAGSAHWYQRKTTLWLGYQALTLLVIGISLQPMNTFYDPRPEQPNTEIASLALNSYTPADVQFSSTNYAGEIRLDSYGFVADPAQQVITLEFLWEGVIPTERPYQIALSATANNPQDGNIVVEPQLYYPQNQTYLTPCWQEGDQIRQLSQFELPVISAPVVWQMSLRVVDEITQDAMIFTTSEGVQTNTFTLAPIRYP